MTPSEIKLVQDSFRKVVPIAATAADLFYGRLFEIAPEVKALFPTDMTEQKKKLISMLAMAVNNLHQMDAVVGPVQKLAERHIDYGVTAEQYAPVGEALLWALAQGIGPDFTAEVEAAWVKTYTTLADIMKKAAADAAAKAT